MNPFVKFLKRIKLYNRSQPTAVVRFCDWDILLDGNRVGRLLFLHVSQPHFCYEISIDDENERKTTINLMRDCTKIVGRIWFKNSERGLCWTFPCCVWFVDIDGPGEIEGCRLLVKPYGCYLQ